MKAQGFHPGGIHSHFPPHILYSFSVHNVGTQGRWVPLGNSLAIVKQHKPIVFRGLSEFHPKKLSLSTSPQPINNNNVFL